jgi:hypothetical protein
MRAIEVSQKRAIVTNPASTIVSFSRRSSATSKSCMATEAASALDAGSSAYASSMNRQPPVASSINLPTAAAPMRASFSPVVGTKLADGRTPSSLSMRASNLPTVVLPVPGFPSSAKLYLRKERENNQHERRECEREFEITKASSTESSVHSIVVAFAS